MTKTAWQRQIAMTVAENMTKAKQETESNQHDSGRVARERQRSITKAQQHDGSKAT